MKSMTCLGVLMALSSATLAAAQRLPDAAPAPEFRDGRPEPAAPSDTLPVPRPEPRPDDGEAPAAFDDAAPGDTPSPAPAPAEEAAPSPVADPRSTLRRDPSGTMPDEEAACRQRLEALGASFEDEAALLDVEVGCSAPWPLMLRSLARGITIEPGAVMSCAMAEAAARFVQDVAAPEAEAAFGTELTGLAQASAYVCRPRHGTGKLSEHAFGNALDIASFMLADGTSVEVELQPPPKAALFLGRVRRAACGPFSTVLGPGSDADHATHLHLDLQPRQNAATWCR